MKVSKRKFLIIAMQQACEEKARDGNGTKGKSVDCKNCKQQAYCVSIGYIRKLCRILDLDFQKFLEA